MCHALPEAFVFLYFSQPAFDGGIIITVFILQSRKLKYRKGKLLFQGRAATRWPSSPRSMLWTPLTYCLSD